MRVISQDGKFDFPYENSMIFHNELYGYDAVAIRIAGDTGITSLARYSTEKKAIKAMEMLREAYNNNEFYHRTATTNTFREVMGILSSEKLKEVTSEHFQFPQDDEIEV